MHMKIENEDCAKMLPSFFKTKTTKSLIIKENIIPFVLNVNGKQ